MWYIIVNANGRETQSRHAAPDVRGAIRRALAEDVGTGDVTTERIVPASAAMRGTIIARQAGVVAGLDVARQVYLEFDPAVSFESAAAEGDRIEPRQTLAVVIGPCPLPC